MKQQWKQTKENWETKQTANHSYLSRWEIFSPSETFLPPKQVNLFVLSALTRTCSSVIIRVCVFLSIHVMFNTYSMCFTCLREAGVNILTLQWGRRETNCLNQVSTSTGTRLGSEFPGTFYLKVSVLSKLWMSILPYLSFTCMFWCLFCVFF